MKIVFKVKVDQPCCVDAWEGFGIIKCIYADSTARVAMYNVSPNTSDGSWAEFAEHRRISMSDIRFDHDTVGRLGALLRTRLTTLQILEPDRCMTVEAISALPVIAFSEELDPRLANIRIVIIAAGDVTKEVDV